MINSKKDYLAFLEADKKALTRSKKKPGIVGDEIWKYERTMRKLEYYANCTNNILFKPYITLLRLKYKKLGMKCGFDIPINVFDAGLSIAHKGTIVINSAVRVGKNCRIHVDVNIGAKAGASQECPKIGDNVYIAPGAKLFGNINIANGIAIGANSVVNKSFNEENITIAGVPAKKISDKGSEGLLVKGLG